MIRRYRKKPVIVEAVLYDGTNGLEITDWSKDEITDFDTHLDVSTLEGHIRANIDDYIIKGVSGEFYPCKPDIFEQSYEKIQRRYSGKAGVSGSGLIP